MPCVRQFLGAVNVRLGAWGSGSRESKRWGEGAVKGVHRGQEGSLYP